MNRIRFFRESIKNLKTVGTITRSSRFLCKGMVKPIDFSKANVIVELGAGDGVVTKHILKGMKKDAKLLAFEVNDLFCEKMRSITDPRLIIVQDGAENLDQHLKENNCDEIDYVVSALPFVVFEEEDAYHIVEKCKERLRLGGLYIQIHYSLLTKKMYKKVFGNVNINFVPINIPPAWVLVSKKSA